MNLQEENIRAAYNAGKDNIENGANETNCHFSHFSSPEQTKAWEQGNKGKKLNIEIVKLK